MAISSLIETCYTDSQIDEMSRTYLIKCSPPTDYYSTPFSTLFSNAFAYATWKFESANHIGKIETPDYTYVGEMKGCFAEGVGTLSYKNSNIFSKCEFSQGVCVTLLESNRNETVPSSYNKIAIITGLLLVIVGMGIAAMCCCRSARPRHPQAVVNASDCSDSSTMSKMPEMSDEEQQILEAMFNTDDKMQSRLSETKVAFNTNPAFITNPQLRSQTQATRRSMLFTQFCIHNLDSIRNPSSTAPSATST